MPAKKTTWEALQGLKSDKLTNFKGEEGKTKVIHFMDDPIYDAVHSIFAQKLFWSARSDWELKEGRLLIKKLGWDAIATDTSPTLRFAVPICVFETNKDGEFLTKDPEKIGFEFQQWTFSGKVGIQINQLVKVKIDLARADLFVSCDDAQFQKLGIHGDNEGAWSDEVLRERVEQAFKSWPHRVMKSIANDLSDADLAKKLKCEVPETHGTDDPDKQLD